MYKFGRGVADVNSAEFHTKMLMFQRTKEVCRMSFWKHIVVIDDVHSTDEKEQIVLVLLNVYT